ncbi:MAG: conjugal transfer protein TraF, partial [Gemmatimonadetes bacterium]|nr:conjugal transfer protein TraF [Gemmatimonadota bacterium]
MHTPHRRWSRVAALLALGCGLGAVVSPARAQLPSASARALGLGDNYAALARGYAAVAWNPANLGMPGNPSFSIALLPLRGTAGLDPITLSDLKEFEGDTVPFARREQWLAEITAEGNESGRSGAEVTYLALSAGRFGFQISTALRTTADIGPDAAELILFGNAGRTGQPQNLDLAGSRFDLVATSSAAVSYAHPLALELGPLPDQHFAVGATLKYVMGHLLASGQDEGSSLTSTPELDISFPVIETDVEGASGNAGSGWGLDVGAAWQGGMFGASLAIHNLVKTFEWDEDQLVMRRGEVLFTQDTSFTDFETTLPLDDP